MTSADEANSFVSSFIEETNRLTLNKIYELPQMSYTPRQPTNFPTTESPVSSLLAANTSTVSHRPSELAVTPIQRPTAYHLIPKLVKAYSYEEVVGKYMREVLKAWRPRLLSPSETEEFLAATRRKLDMIRELEDIQESFAPLVDPATEDALLVARVDHRIHFAQIFRINDLPPEILTNIFRYIVWSANEPRRAVQWRLNLTWSCRIWRRVAIADSTMWTAIWFQAPHFERAFTWLERAGASPVDVRISDTEEDILNLETAAELIDRVFVKLSNIRMIIADFVNWDPAMYIVHALGRVASSQLPMILQRLELHRSGTVYAQISDDHAYPPFRQPMALFGGAVIPSFRHFTCNGVHLDWERSLLVNLTTLDLRRMPLERGPSLAIFRSMLANNPTLGELILDGAGPKLPDRPINHLKPISMPHLEGLKIGDFNLVYGKYVFTQLNAPNIVALTLMNLMVEDYSAFFNCLTPKLPALRSLTIHNAEIKEPSAESKGALVDWLKSVPNLTYLRVSNVSAAFLDFFLYNPNPDTVEPPPDKPKKRKQIICPKLVYLEYHVMNSNIIATWVLKRRLLGAPLKKVYVGASTAPNVSSDQRKKLFEAFEGVHKLFVLSPIGRSPEETKLLSG